MSLCKMCICCTATAISKDTISIRIDKQCYSCLVPFSCWFGHTVGYALEYLLITISTWLGFCSNKEGEKTSKNHIFSATFRTSGTSKILAPSFLVLFIKGHHTPPVCIHSPLIHCAFTLESISISTIGHTEMLSWHTIKNILIQAQHK